MILDGNITRILKLPPVLDETRDSTIPRYLFAMKFTVSGARSSASSILRAPVCTQKRDIDINRGQGRCGACFVIKPPLLSKVVNLLRWTLAGTTLFQAIRLLARFCFKLFTTLDPWLREVWWRGCWHWPRQQQERTSVYLFHLGRGDRLTLIVMSKDRFLMEEGFLRNVLIGFVGYCSDYSILLSRY